MLVFLFCSVKAQQRLIYATPNPDIPVRDSLHTCQALRDDSIPEQTIHPTTLGHPVIHKTTMTFNLCCLPVYLLHAAFQCLISTATSVPIHVYPGTHFIPLPKITVYESSLPLTYVHSHPSSNLPAPSSTGFPKCLFSRDHECCSIQNAVREMEENLEAILTPEPHNVTIYRARRSITSIGNFLNYCCGTATDEELYTLTDNEETVNKHLNNLQLIEKLDHEDLLK